MITCSFEDGGKGNLRHAVVDALVVMDGKVLFAKRSQKLSTEPGKYCIPGGYLNRDETLLEGAKRELKEETGYVAEGGILFHMRDNPINVNDTHRQNVSFMYLFTDAHLDSQSNLDWDSDKPEWIQLSDINDIKEQIGFDHWQVIEAYRNYIETSCPLPIWNAVLTYKK